MAVETAGEPPSAALNPESSVSDVRACLKELNEPTYGTKAEVWARLSRAEAAELVHLDLIAEFERRQLERRQLDLARMAATWNQPTEGPGAIPAVRQPASEEHERINAENPDGDAGLSPASEFFCMTDGDTTNSSSRESNVTVLPPQGKTPEGPTSVTITAPVDQCSTAESSEARSSALLPAQSAETSQGPTMQKPRDEIWDLGREWRVD